MNTQADEALRLGKRLIEALTHGDSEAAIGLFHEKIILEVPFPLVKGEDTTGTKIQRGNAVHAYVRDVEQRASQLRFENVVWRTTNDGLAIFQADGNHTLVDRRSYKNHFLFMFEVADGKIIRWREYLNPVPAVRAFGAPLDSLP